MIPQRICHNRASDCAASRQAYALISKLLCCTAIKDWNRP